MVARMLEKSKRAEVNVDKQRPSSSARVLNQTDANRPNPKAGDIFVKSDGTRVTLEVGPSGVLGEGQGVSIYEGMKYPNGDTLKHGDLGRESWGYMGQMFLKDNRTGSGFFREDWLKIEKYELQEAMKIQNPQENQIVGNYTQYLDGDWVWIGPSQ